MSEDTRTLEDTRTFAVGSPPKTPNAKLIAVYAKVFCPSCGVDLNVTLLKVTRSHICPSCGGVVELYVVPA